MQPIARPARIHCHPQENEPGRLKPKLIGLRTKRETVDRGFWALLKLKKQESIRTFRGKLDWEGGLDEMRFEK